MGFSTFCLPILCCLVEVCLDNVPMYVLGTNFYNVNMDEFLLEFVGLSLAIFHIVAILLGYLW